jgi:hypothetical protein
VLGQVRQTQSRAGFEVKTPRRISETSETAAASLCQRVDGKKVKGLEQEKMKMSYRIEDAEPDGWLLVRHVETDREVGTALEYPVHIDGRVVHAFKTFNNAGEEVGFTTSGFHSFPLEIAARAIAYYEEHNGFPDLKNANWNAQSDRVERRLGKLIADTALAFARGFCEAVGQGLTAETRDQFAASLAELGSLCRVSRAGCYNATARTIEPYFANPLPGMRLNFSDAAQWYGMCELQARRPDLNDAERQKLLGWVLRWVADALSRAEQEINAEKKRLAS